MKNIGLGWRGKLLAASAMATLAVAVIFLISPKLASDDRHACQADGEALKAITPTEPPVKLPDLAFERADGSTLTLADHAGRGVVLNFWATWCAPCIREMPELDALGADLAADGIDVLAASMDRGGHRVIGPFFEANKIDHLAPLLDAKGAAGRSVGVHGLPTTLIIDGEGREMARITGIHHYDTPETKAYLRRCIGTK